MINKSNRLSRTAKAFGLALVASLALSGLAAGSASALSQSPPGQAFMASSGALLFSTTGGDRTQCVASRGSGHADATGTGGNTTILFEGCRWEGAWPCTSPGMTTSGWVVTKKLNFKPVYLDAAKTKFGLLLTPASGNVVAEMTCGNWFKAVWTGSIIGRITNPPLNVAATKHTLLFETAGGTGEQVYDQVEEAGTKHHLQVSYTGGPLKGLALSSEHTLQFANPVKYVP